MLFSMSIRDGSNLIDFVIDGHCPSTSWCWQLQALTVCSALFLSLVENERRAVLPSIAITPKPVSSLSEDTHA
jgi:hypothetical protein